MPVCPRPGHDGSRVVFDGHYGKPGHRRQRYRCHPPNGDKWHRFTPPVPRQDAVGGECEHCERELHTHEGRTRHAPRCSARETSRSGWSRSAVARATAPRPRAFAPAARGIRCAKTVPATAATASSWATSSRPSPRSASSPTGRRCGPTERSCSTRCRSASRHTPPTAAPFPAAWSRSTCLAPWLSRRPRAALAPPGVPHRRSRRLGVIPVRIRRRAKAGRLRRSWRHPQRRRARLPQRRHLAVRVAPAREAPTATRPRLGQHQQRPRVATAGGRDA